MRKLTLSLMSLILPLLIGGCYTQVGYYEPSPRLAKTRTYEKPETQEAEPSEVEEDKEEQKSTEDEGYYGTRKPTYRTYTPYYYDGPYTYYYDGPYYYAPYYAPYSYGYYGYPYYPYYGYGYRRYYSHYDQYHYPRTKIGDLHFGEQRPQSHRGVESRQPASIRPSRSRVDTQQAPSSGSQYDNLRRTQRRH